MNAKSPTRPPKPEAVTGQFADRASENGGPADSTMGSGERIAKVMARAGLCSRREAESWIADGRVSLNGRKLDTPAQTVTPSDTVLVDGKPLPDRAPTRLWLYHKPRGLVTSNNDPEGRKTVFEALPAALPRVISVGRLDINTEGLLLLTNDGGLARVLELPATGWMRRYRVRAHIGSLRPDALVTALDRLKGGITVEGVRYGGIEAALDRTQGQNAWLTLGLREGKNREVKKVLGSLGLSVNRLIRLSYGPFQLGDLKEGTLEEVKTRVLKDQLGTKLVMEAGAVFAERYEMRQGTPGPNQKRPPSPKAPGAKKKPPSAKTRAARLDQKPGTKPGSKPGPGGKPHNHAHRRRKG